MSSLLCFSLGVKALETLTSQEFEPFQKLNTDNDFIWDNQQKPYFHNNKDISPYIITYITYVYKYDIKVWFLSIQVFFFFFSFMNSVFKYISSRIFKIFCTWRSQAHLKNWSVLLKHPQIPFNQPSNEVEQFLFLTWS